MRVPDGTQLDLYKKDRVVTLGLSLEHLTILSFVGYNSVDGSDCFMQNRVKNISRDQIVGTMVAGHSIFKGEPFWGAK